MNCAAEFLVGVRRPTVEPQSWWVRYTSIPPRAQMAANGATQSSLACPQMRAVGGVGAWRSACRSYLLPSLSSGGASLGTALAAHAGTPRLRLSIGIVTRAQKIYRESEAPMQGAFCHGKSYSQ